MKTNFKKFMAMLLAVLMVTSVFSTLATAVGTATSDTCPVSGGDHTWVQYGSDEEAIIPPTCVEDGYTWIICSGCKKVDIKDIKFATGHTEGDWIIDVEASCESGGRDGSKHTECEVCKVTLRTEVISGLTAHKFVWKEDNPEAKCGDNHRIYHQCVNPGSNPGGICGYIREHKDEIKKHNYVEYEVIKEPSCFEYGILRYACTQTYIEDGVTKTCGSFVDVKIAKTAHTLVDHEGQAATCTEDGYKPYQTCSVEGCGYTTYEKIPATGHMMDFVVVPATCTEDGYIYGECRNCEYTHTVAGQPALGHDMGDWYETTAPECEGEGAKRRDCKHGCGHFETDVVDATGHDYKGVVTPPTCTEKGYTTYTCANGCGSSYIGNYVDETGHDWGDWVNISGGTCVDQSLWRRTCAAGCVENDRREYGTHPQANRINIVKFAKNTDDDDINDPTNATYVNNECWVRFDCTLCMKNAIEEKVAHNPDSVVAGIVVEAATCEKAGRYADHCLDCGNWTFYAMPVEDHKQDPVLVPGYDSTCTETGRTDGYYCNNCKLTITKQEVIPAKGHTPGDAADCENAQICLVCLTELTPALGHNYLLNAEGSKPSTCVSQGRNEYVCENCRDKKYEILPLADHTPGDEATCTEPQICTVCKTELAPANGHTPGDAATCTEPQICTVCKIELAPANGHSFNVEEATCTVNKYCLLCGHIEEYAGPHKHPKDHSYWVVTKEPTCTESGVATGFCDMCDREDLVLTWDMDLSDYMKERLAPTNHEALEDCTYVKVDQTCVTDGYESWTCDKCNTEIKRNILSADGESHPADKLGYHKEAYIHTNGKGYARTPSCAAAGLLWYYCEACAAVDSSYQGFTVTEVGSQMDCHSDLSKLTLDVDASYPASCTEDGLNIYYCKHPHIIVFEDPDNKGVYKTETRECSYTTAQILPAGGHTIVVTNFIAPTCTENGVFEAYCTGCKRDDLTQEEIIASIGAPEEIYKATGHNYQLIDSKPAGCISQGEDVYACAYCRDRKSVIYEALGHFPGSEATCTEDQICLDCKEILAPALGHDYEEDVTDPTCTEIGYTTYTCAACGDSYVGNEVKANGHDYDVVVTPASCEQYGNKFYTCVDCGHQYAENIDPTGHDYQPGKVVAPICDGEGFTFYDCANGCGSYEKRDYVNALGHSHVVIESEAATCLKEGYEIWECPGCGDTYTVVLEKAPHNPFWPNEFYQCIDHMTSPTCDEPGIGWGSYCQNFFGTKDQHCADNHDEIEPYGHKYKTFWVEAGCENFGCTYVMCLYCGEGHGVATEEYPDGMIWENGVAVEGVITDYVPALGHNWIENLVKDPTCTENGCIYAECDRCHKVEEGKAIPATGHKAPNHKDADGKFLPSTVECENGCGTILSGHRDAEGNDMFEYREDRTCQMVELDDGTIICEKTYYEIAYCTECTYREVLNIWISKDTEHNMVPDEEYNEAHARDELNGGSYKEYCSNDCGYYFIEDYDAELEGQVIIDNDIYGCYEDGTPVKGENMIVNGGFMAVKLKMSGANVDVWGISFDLFFDSDKLVFEKALTEAVNADNGFINDFNAVGSTLRVMSTFEEGNGLENNNFTGLDVEYMTLIFSVKATAYEKTAANILADQFAFTKTEVIDNEKNPANFSFNQLGETVIWKAADLDANGLFGLGDANDLMTLIVDGGYDVRADIDMNGEIEIADFRAIKKIQMNDGLVDGIYEDILNGYIVA